VLESQLSRTYLLRRFLCFSHNVINSLLLSEYIHSVALFCFRSFKRLIRYYRFLDRHHQRRYASKLYRRYVFRKIRYNLSVLKRRHYALKDMLLFNAFISKASLLARYYLLSKQVQYSSNINYLMIYKWMSQRSLLGSDRVTTDSIIFNGYRYITLALSKKFSVDFVSQIKKRFLFCITQSFGLKLFKTVMRGGRKDVSARIKK